MSCLAQPRLPTRWATAFRRFLRAEGGDSTVEFVLTFPLVIWTLTSMVGYWEIYREKNALQKATYIVADVISRSGAMLPVSYLEGLQRYMDLLMANADPVLMRYTSVFFDLNHKDYKVSWSYGTSEGMPPLTDLKLDRLRDRLPEIGPFETFLIVESAIPEEKQGGLAPAWAEDEMETDELMSEFVVVRPRWGTVCIEGRDCLQ